ncbi:MAG: hypothetical protein LBI43_05850 [Streptococcaceae bacterium]|jgi:hypothetical protein|nr:hypothetical protein [Streptococcaceae bacterium]
MKKSLLIGAVILASLSLAGCSAKKKTSSDGMNQITQTTPATPTTVAELAGMVASNHYSTTALYQFTGTFVNSSSWAYVSSNNTYNVQISGNGSTLNLSAPADDVNTWTDNTQASVTVRVSRSSKGTSVLVTSATVTSGATTLNDKVQGAFDSVTASINKQLGATGIDSVTLNGSFPDYNVNLDSNLNQMSTANLDSSITNINSSYTGSVSKYNVKPTLHYILGGKEIAKATNGGAAVIE